MRSNETGSGNIIGLLNFNCFYMFGLLKRTKIEPWETQLLENVLRKLPDEYSNLINQISDGLFRGVLVDVSDIHGYVAFTFHSDKLKKYDKINEPDFNLTNILVYDSKISEYIPYEIYISRGTISGYSLGGNKKHNIDVNKVEVSDFKRVYIGKDDYDRIASILNEDEKELLSPSEVYSVYVFNKEYFHIKDLEDGDFIGVDENKIVYKISHDPQEVMKLDLKIVDVLK